MADAVVNDERRKQKPDADALIRLGTVEQAGGHLDTAERLFREALCLREGSPEPDDAALVFTLSALGQVLVARGELEEARSVLTRALELTDQGAGANDAHLAILLNELSRLYLKQSAYSSAEPHLRRLLAIKQAKGEQRPEVATVLASLAAVHTALGDYAEAEQLYRRALGIREKTLSPNHYTTAATLECLADTCAARGKFVDAISLSRRALSMRELTLGASDPSVGSARERIADLQLQAPEQSRWETTGEREIGAIAPVFTAPRPPTQPPTPVSVSVQPPARVPAQPPVPVPEPEPAKQHAQRVFREIEQPRPVEWALTEHATNSDSPRLPSVLIPWASELTAVQEEIGVSDRRDATGALALWRHSIATRLETRSSKATALSVAVVALIVAALGVESLLGRKADRPTFVEAEPFNAASHAQAQRLGVAPSPITAPVTPSEIGASAPVVPNPAARPARSPVPNPAASAPLVAPIKPNTVAAREGVTARNPVVSTQQPPGLPRAILPAISLPNIDATGGVPNLPTRTITDSFPVRLSASGRSEGVGDAEGRTLTMPKLLGAAPQPRYPDRLRDFGIGGEVLVQFVVDENGRADVASMKALRSPHEMLTNAVRDVLSQFRFEPARTAPPESKPRAETVKYAFTFHAPGR